MLQECLLRNFSPSRYHYAALYVFLHTDSPTLNLNKLPSRDTIVRRGETGLMVFPLAGNVSTREGLTSLVIFRNAAVCPSGKIGISMTLTSGGWVSNIVIWVGFICRALVAGLLMDFRKSLILCPDPCIDIDISDSNTRFKGAVISFGLGIDLVTPIAGRVTEGTTVVTTVWKPTPRVDGVTPSVRGADRVGMTTALV